MMAGYMEINGPNNLLIYLVKIVTDNFISLLCAN